MTTVGDIGARSELTEWMRKTFVTREEFEREIKALEERMTKKIDAATDVASLDLEGWIVANKTLYMELAKLLSIWPTDHQARQQ
jgi:hypothetical protein